MHFLRPNAGQRIHHRPLWAWVQVRHLHTIGWIEGAWMEFKCWAVKCSNMSCPAVLKSTESSSQSYRLRVAATAKLILPTFSDSKTCQYTQLKGESLSFSSLLLGLRCQIGHWRHFKISDKMTSSLRFDLLAKKVSVKQTCTVSFSRDKAEGCKQGANKHAVFSKSRKVLG